MANEDYARASWHMAIVDHIDKQFIERLLFDPAVKHINKTAQVNSGVVFYVDLDVNMLKVQNLINSCLWCAGCFHPHSIVAAVDGFDKQLGFLNCVMG